MIAMATRKVALCHPGLDMAEVDRMARYIPDGERAREQATTEDYLL